LRKLWLVESLLLQINTLGSCIVSSVYLQLAELECVQIEYGRWALCRSSSRHKKILTVTRHDNLPSM